MTMEQQKVSQTGTAPPPQERVDLSAAPLSFLRLLVTLAPVEPLPLPAFSGFALKGALGMAVRTLFCDVGEGGLCSRPDSCPYHYLFETSHQSPSFRQAPQDPHPVVLQPLSEGKPEYQPGETVSFGVVLLGQGIDFLPQLITALEELGGGRLAEKTASGANRRLGLGPGRARYLLIRVDAVDGAEGSADSRTVYDGVSRRFLDVSHPLTWAEAVQKAALIPSERITVHLLTPMRLQHHGHLAVSLDFPLLMRNLLRRISWICERHCGAAWDAPFRDLLERASGVRTLSSSISWSDLDRFSFRQKTRVPMGGMVGTVVFEGVPEELRPVLALGQHLHVGKGTIYGLGQLLIENSKGRIIGDSSV